MSVKNRSKCWCRLKINIYISKILSFLAFSRHFNSTYVSWNISVRFQGCVKEDICKVMSSCIICHVVIHRLCRSKYKIIMIIINWIVSCKCFLPISWNSGFGMRQRHWIAIVLECEASQVPVIGEKVVHFCHAFLSKSQPIFWCKSRIKKRIEMIVAFIDKFIRHNKWIRFQITMFMFKVVFKMLRWPNETTPKNAL